MSFISRHELAKYGKDELHSTLRSIFNDLANSKPNSQECRNALASIENIRREIRSRALCH